MNIPLDKQAHALSGAVIVFMAHALTQSILLSLLACGLAAIGKELYDYHHPDKHTCDAWDAVATVAGGVLVAVIILGALYVG